MRVAAPFLKVCRRSDPKLDECVMAAVEELRPHLVKGIPEFGIPSCEPLEIKEMVLDQGQGVARLTSTYTDIKVHGPTNFRLETVRIDLDRRRVFLKLWLPYLRMTSHYKMDGRLLVLPITGSGYYEGNYTDIQAVCTLHGEHVSIRGQTHFSVKNFDVKFSIGGAKVFLGDLFNGDRELGEAMNLFLNENWKNVATELQPLLEAKIGDVFRQFSNSIYHKFPLDQILPP
ncbi:Protein takeout [Zootermopsis nevadensis]|uniref:Protein takeout n=1 Tax=Zootermopsis nevadensis TaxID=136037 RepID=A0A067QVN1_ZOONE|nr:Protein takeout [Zootermopsis nevadensis]